MLGHLGTPGRGHLEAPQDVRTALGLDLDWVLVQTPAAPLPPLVTLKMLSPSLALVFSSVKWGDYFLPHRGVL